MQHRSDRVVLAKLFVHCRVWTKHMVLLAAPLFLSERSNGANSGVGGGRGGGCQEGQDKDLRSVSSGLSLDLLTSPRYDLHG